MTRVKLVGPAADGQHLIVATETGEEYSLAITEQLRSAVRHARVAAQALSDAESDAPSMSPKVVQQRIRAGLNAAELAELSGMPIASLEKYEAPVLAERAYIAELARSTRIGRDSGSPVLGDLVTDRLAGRGVDVENLAWDAWREEGEPWQVCVDFRIEDRNIRALWSFDHTSRTVTAEDEEARWLTETELLDVPIPRRHLSSVRSDDEANVRPLYESRPVVPAVGSESEHDDVDAATPTSAPSSTELLLEDLDGKRGTRDTLAFDLDGDDDDDDGSFEGFGPAAKAREADVGFTADRNTAMPHPAGSGHASDEPAPASSPVTPAMGEKKPAKKGRASVPSWDEIVFGAKND
jgi:hypothetical protein